MRIQLHDESAMTSASQRFSLHSFWIRVRGKQGRREPDWCYQVFTADHITERAVDASMHVAVSSRTVFKSNTEDYTISPGNAKQCQAVPRNAVLGLCSWFQLVSATFGHLRLSSR